MTPLILPTPQPTELINSLLLRVATLNALGSIDEVCAATLPRRLAELKDLGREAMMICAVSALYGLSEEQVIQRHTLIPFHRAFSADDSPASHSFSIRLCSRFSERATKIPKSFRYCSCCVAEDIQWHHFSFYRRHHQLMPIGVCSKHGTRLHAAGAAHNSMLPSDPHFPMNEAVALESDDMAPIAYHFRQMAEDMLDNPRPFNGSVVSSRLRHVARTQGFKTGQPETAKEGSIAHKLSQRADEDAIWTRRVLSENSKQGCAGPTKKLNNALFEAEKSSSAVLLSALVLCPSANAAMQLLSDRSPPPPQKIFLCKPVAVQNLVSTFYANKGNLKAIEAALGISRASLANRLTKLGLTDLDRKQMFSPIAMPSAPIAPPSSLASPGSNRKTVQALTARQIIAIRLVADGCLLDDAATRAGTDRTWLESYVCQVARPALDNPKHESA